MERVSLECRFSPYNIEIDVLGNTKYTSFQDELNIGVYYSSSHIFDTANPDRDLPLDMILFTIEVMLKRDNYHYKRVGEYSSYRPYLRPHGRRCRFLRCGLLEAHIGENAYSVLTTI